MSPVRTPRTAQFSNTHWTPVWLALGLQGEVVGCPASTPFLEGLTTDRRCGLLAGVSQRPVYSQLLHKLLKQGATHNMFSPRTQPNGSSWSFTSSWTLQSVIQEDKMSHLLALPIVTLSLSPYRVPRDFVLKIGLMEHSPEIYQNWCYYVSDINNVAPRREKMDLRTLVKYSSNVA